MIARTNRLIMDTNTSLYPDILFHFTTKESLWSILRDTFSVSYSREKIVGIDNDTEFYTPMVSFCDLKISELKSHMEKYGSYGIGLTKRWANSKGLNPVFYVNKESPFTSDFITAVNALHMQRNNIPGIIGKILADSTYKNILNSYRYIKNYEGKLIRKNGEITENYRFADEREWRYVPSIDTKIIPPLISINTISSDDKKSEYDKAASAIKIGFEPDDIKYLIIDNDDEILELMQHLEKVKAKFPEKVRQRLSSRILTAEQIHQDI